MICRHCGTEINTLVREADGSVICTGCGTVYRPKKAMPEKPLPYTQREAVSSATYNYRQHSKKSSGTREIYLNPSIGSKTFKIIIAVFAFAVVTIITATICLWNAKGQNTLNSTTADYCPTNYSYGGLVAHSEDGYSYFVLYNDSDYEHQTINICRIADGSDTSEVIYSESATNGVDIRSGEFHGSFIRYGALTAYKDSLFFIREYNNNKQLVCIHTTDNSMTVVSENPNYTIDNVQRDDKYLFIGGNSIVDLETETLLPVFKKESVMRREEAVIEVLGISRECVYFRYIFLNSNNMPVSYSDLYRVSFSGDKLEPLSSSAMDNGYHECGISKTSFVYGGFLWLYEVIEYYDGSKAYKFQKINIDTGEVTILPNNIPIKGLAAINHDGFYYFDDSGKLWKCDFDGDNQVLLISVDTQQYYKKAAPMLSGNRIFYVSAENDDGLFYVNMEDREFPQTNIMGELLAGANNWCIGPHW